jgi:hypothetical protein
MIAGVRRSSSFALRLENSAFCAGYGRRALRRSLMAMRRTRLAVVYARRRRSDAQQATRIGEWVGAASDGISSAGSRVDRSRCFASKSPTRNASMRARAVRCAAALALVAAPLPANAQYFPPPLIIVPPPAQDYSAPRPAPKPQPPKPRPAAETPPPAKPTGHYQGQTFVPD